VKQVEKPDKMLTHIVLPVTPDASSEFDSALATALASGSRVFVLFTGAAVEGGASWCKDCEDCKPMLKAMFAEAGSIRATTLIEVPLAREGYKGNAANWARVHTSVKLTAVPTIMRWGKVKKLAELVDLECKDAGRVRDLVVDDGGE
jgi:hypothetical protein